MTEAGVPSVQTGASFKLYVESRGNFASTAVGSIQSGVVIANTGPASASVNLELFSLEGALVGTSSQLTVLPRGQIARFLNEIDGFQDLPEPFQGVLRITTDVLGGVAVTGLRVRFNERRDLLIATTPGIADDTAPFGDLVFPHMADGGGFSTQFILLPQGTGGDGTLRFVSPSGTDLSPQLQTSLAGVLEGAFFNTDSGPDPETVLFSDISGGLHTALAYPGQVHLAVGTSSTVDDVQALLVPFAGTILQQIPQLGLYLVGVSPGSEVQFISAAWANPIVLNAQPNLVLELDQTSIVDLTDKVKVPAGLVPALLATANPGSTVTVVQIDDFLNPKASLGGQTHGGVVDDVQAGVIGRSGSTRIHIFGTPCSLPASLCASSPWLKSASS